jgi:hypothetical protein
MVPYLTTAAGPLMSTAVGPAGLPIDADPIEADNGAVVERLASGPGDFYGGITADVRARLVKDGTISRKVDAGADSGFPMLLTARSLCGMMSLKRAVRRLHTETP